jgi:hypothetical protein
MQNLGAAKLADLHWLSGCWARDGLDTGSVEAWSTAAGGTMFGFSRDVRDGRTVAWEQLRIVAKDDGGIDYIATPSGQATTSFQMLSLARTEVVFENKEHDFPQRVIYRLEGQDKLVGRIEGSLNGKARSAEFPMTRVDCDNVDD